MEKCVRYNSLANSRRHSNNIFHKPKYNKLFNFGIDRYASVLHTRLRFERSDLNEHLFRMNCVPSPHCRCGLNIICFTALVMPLSESYFLPQLAQS